METEGKPERWGLFANVTGDRVLRDGAKVQLVSVNGGGESWQVRGLSRGGRRITKYVRIERLSNWRPRMLKPGDLTGWSYPTKEEAAQDWSAMIGKEAASATGT